MSSAYRFLAICAVLTGALAAGAAVPRAGQATPGESGCVTCHAKLPTPLLSAPVAAYRDDIHRERGFGCSDCHGGNPKATDEVNAKSAAYGYRGQIEAEGVIAMCARCHSDAEFMRGYAPRQRVDQASEYAASVHGKRLAAGDRHVANCASCHSAHGIRQVSDARSPVFPTNVAATCARCHADAAHMAGYKTPDGSPLPTSQRADYEKSVHYEALVKRNDLSAPTCNDCHGNHGAAPPGVGTVANVCGTCHAVFAARFELSAHRQIFDRGCVECHGNHAVAPPGDEMLGTGPEAICASCHAEGDTGFEAAKTMRAGLERLKGSLDRAGGLIASVHNAGMEVSDEELALGEARAKLTLARTEIHAFNPSSVEPIITSGLDIVGGVEGAGQAAFAELRFRRRGLAASLAAIVIFVVGLAFKVREIDRRQQV
jgi:predicted CXXCH cytochrome family protein